MGKITTPHNIQWKTYHRDGRVYLRLGNVEIDVDYETGFDIGAGLRTAAKEAKHFSGDRSRHFRLSGILVDANKS